ncbi:PQQ-dependent dehydrogenase, methanol/ethanol family [Denitratisoma sp. DHT3]|uniref:PQQ-dependent dehydrogenase, methanol/ethanol family n=1 Tax=Denitratisoma sp. DHT3 TaxID=1981880 RepID=UPI0011983831|nr:PQQ-dependent dehydrogenase, methanol/ethanol family [Denitratisoma sp. DHT3]QDX80189.1 PQQ-dependent dehydrogenase, methanol/ethanol family [Denitratisoma sp. DHT3]
MRNFHRSWLVAASLLVLSGNLMAAGPTAPRAAAVDGARLVAADREPGNWMSHGRTYSEQRFSPLEQINDRNVSRLGLAWSQTLEFERGVEATPLMVDGALYITGAWSIVYAFDAETGKPLWKYDPKVDRAMVGNTCCGPVNRGVAVWQGKVYVGTLDGRLVAIDAATGKKTWETLTVDPKRPYSITGAPRVVKGKVLIGNGGADMGVRGYVSAYDARSGKLVWRFYTVPGDPSKPFENKAMEMAAKTWRGDQWWTWGGGGTVWDAMSYDPELDLLYIGVGNAATWPRDLRSPGGGDNLFLSSIVALKPESGEYVWHYQLAPGEQWDYPATTQMVLADLMFQGEMRKVLVQAPKHGFVFVLDRTNGKLLSAEKFTQVNWASHYDLATGRPVENPVADYAKAEKPALQYPGPLGGHNWNPMSFNPKLGLLYFGELQMPNFYVMDRNAKYRERNRRWNTGLDMAPWVTDPSLGGEVAKHVRGSLIAWDVAAGRKAWQVEQLMPTNGGTLATAGNLVFHGTSDGRLVAYSADKGEKLWEYRTVSAIMGGPIAYRIKGRQYIATGIGWGGGHATGFPDGATAQGLKNVNRVVVFALDGKARLPAVPRLEQTIDPPPATASMEQIVRGGVLYMNHCGVCHGSGTGGVPNLDAMTPQTRREFMGIVLGGARQDKGMPAFHEQLSAEEVLAIQDFLVARANMTKAAQQKGR